jgi:hypothetical protein
MLSRRRGTWEHSSLTSLQEVSGAAEGVDRKLTVILGSNSDQDNRSTDPSVAFAPCRSDCGCFSRADWVYNRDQQYYAGPKRFDGVVRPIRAQ